MPVSLSPLLRDTVAIVCGGRDYEDADYVNAVLSQLAPAGIIHGAARGADSLAATWGAAAASRGVRVLAMPADWKKHGRAAGPLRNTSMLTRLLLSASRGRPIAVIAFPGGAGTANMVKQARTAGVRVIDLRHATTTTPSESPPCSS